MNEKYWEYVYNHVYLPRVFILFHITTCVKVMSTFSPADCSNTYILPIILSDDYLMKRFEW